MLGVGVVCNALLLILLIKVMGEIETKNDEKIVDENSRVACKLHAHMLLLYHNIRLEELTEDIASPLLYVSCTSLWFICVAITILIAIVTVITVVVCFLCYRNVC